MRENFANLIKLFFADTEDCAGAVWNPSSDNVAVWDTCLYYRVQVRLGVGVDFCSYVYLVNITGLDFVGSQLV